MAVRARPRAPATHFFLPYEKNIRVPFVSIRGSIIPPFVYFVYFVVHSLLNVRTAEWPCGRATRASHALPSTFFSLLSTFETIPPKRHYLE